MAKDNKYSVKNTVCSCGLCGCILFVVVQIRFRSYVDNIFVPYVMFDSFSVALSLFIPLTCIPHLCHNNQLSKAVKL